MNVSLGNVAFWPFGRKRRPTAPREFATLGFEHKWASEVETRVGLRILLRSPSAPSACRLLYFLTPFRARNASLACAKVSKSLSACFSSDVISFRPVQLVAEANEVDLRAGRFQISRRVHTLP